DGTPRQELRLPPAAGPADYVVVRGFGAGRLRRILPTRACELHAHRSQIKGGKVMNAKIGRRSLLAGAALAAALPHAGKAQGQQLVVNTYGARWERFWRDTLLPGFQRSSGLQATLDIGLGRTWMANLRAAGVSAPPYSILMINEVFANVLRAEGFFDRIDTSKLTNWSKLHPLAQNEGNSVFGMISPIGLGYRKDLVRTPPRAWKDLWDNPEFRGKIGLYQIGNSAGQMFVMLTGRL